MIEKAVLTPTFFMDFESAIIQAFVDKNTTSEKSKEEKAIELYYAVRDLIRYDPYTYSFDRATFKATHVIKTGRAWCVPKAILYTACCRAIGVPARLGFADVRNHLSTERMRKTMKTDVFVWHGYTSVFLHGQWVKATPAFNIELCEKFGLKPLEFDGTTDSIYHPYDLAGNEHMEYLTDHGVFDDFPHQTMVDACIKMYGEPEKTDANFEEDVEKEVNPITGC
ncbi:MAG: transglutaminase family protein [Saprospiraceae bacterium]